MAVFQFILSSIRRKSLYIFAAIGIMGLVGHVQAQELPADADITIKETLAAAHNGDVESMYSVAIYLLEQGQQDQPD